MLIRKYFMYKSIKLYIYVLNISLTIKEKNIINLKKKK